MSQDIVNLEVNGVAVQGRKGQMIIHVTDASNVYVPRFCYHEKLSIAANCRMCLVEVEKAPKPLPACATPIAEGMKIFTKSPRAISAQKATMEFLLINHPLDCPICDQGGECELQDLAMGFGRDAARYEETKRVVKDKNIGPLVSTDMTRCIHCTRCVRFTAEIAGLQELGTIGRGEQTQIGTFIEKSVDHEMSGNIIDLCPVGALNSKPFRYQGRSWEMVQQPLVSPHDAVGTNLNAHVRRGKLMRVVPRANEAVNETWIADRDRFSYEGVYAEDRLETPLIRRNGELVPTSWEVALEAAALALKDGVAGFGADRIGVLSLPSATSEEAYLLARLARGLGISNLDHRLRQLDTRDQGADAVLPGLGLPLAALETLDGVLVVGADLRQEAPVFAHRLRKAAVANNAQISFVNPAEFDYLFPVAAYRTVPVAAMVAELAGIGRAVAEAAGQPLPALLASAAAPADGQRAAARALASGTRRLVLLGGLAERHPAYADLRSVAAAVATLAGATLGYLPGGANAAGASLAGLLPHRQAGGRAATRTGLAAGAMLAAGLDAYVLFGGVETALDTAFGEAAEAALAKARFVLALTPFAPASVRRHAHIVLPIGTFAETSGSFVNLEGRWQSFTAVARPVGESRPGWKVLRVLGNLLDLAGFDYESSEDVRQEFVAALGALAGQGADTAYRGSWQVQGPVPGQLTSLPIYQTDPIVRRAPALQQTRTASRPAVAY
ncbi:MAG: NADH-quinone oxidoreductase subunit NuoG [Pseudomonadota bacterium]